MGTIKASALKIVLRNPDGKARNHSKTYKSSWHVSLRRPNSCNYFSNETDSSLLLFWLIYFCIKTGKITKLVLTSHTQVHHLCRNNGYLLLHSLVFGRELQNKGDLKCKKIGSFYKHHAFLLKVWSIACQWDNFKWFRMKKIF